MPERVLETVFRRMDEYLKSFPQENITFTWHGGEPFILPPAYFKKAGYLQAKHCSETKDRIKHQIQSNLTLLTQGHIDALRDLGIFHYSSSYDPIPHIRGMRTQGKLDSESYNHAFMCSLRLLERNGLTWSIIYVVHRESLKYPLDIYRYLLNLCDGKIMFNPVMVIGEDTERFRISPEEYADFLGELLSEWWPKRKIYPEVKPLAMYQEIVMNGNHRFICNDGGRCSSEFMFIGPDGSTSLCCTSADFGVISFGNIQEKSIADIFRDTVRDRIREKNYVLPKKECKGCRFWNLCHGGCPTEAYLEFGDFIHKSSMSCYRIRFVEKYFEPLSGVRYNGTFQGSSDLTTK
jgi:uncharacterized protein